MWLNGTSDTTWPSHLGPKTPILFLSLAPCGTPTASVPRSCQSFPCCVPPVSLPSSSVIIILIQAFISWCVDHCSTLQLAAWISGVPFFVTFILQLISLPSALRWLLCSSCKSLMASHHLPEWKPVFSAYCSGFQKPDLSLSLSPDCLFLSSSRNPIPQSV